MSKELEALEKELNLLHQQKDNLLHKQARAKTDNEIKYWQFRIDKFNEKISAFTNIKQSLLELKAIKEANSSEALEIVNSYLKVFKEENSDVIYDIELFKKEIETIKQTILKAQEMDFNYNEIVIPFLNELAIILGINDIDEMLDKIKEQEKALSIIKEKDVDIEFLKSADTFEEYNKLIKFKTPFAIALTQEEFELLKETLKPKN